MSASRSSSARARYCAFCAMGNHARCTGSGGATGAGSCECGDRAHDPEVRVAAAMGAYIAPDLAGAPIEALATEWRRFDERSAR